MSNYQTKYLAHQMRKKKVLMKIMKQRHSTRIFADRELEERDLHAILASSLVVPSSCNRRGVSVKSVTDRDEKAILGGLLVGGVGWIHRAPTVLVIIADPEAYKAKGEEKYMPYLDAGVIVQQMWLMATALNVKYAYVNPNIRQMNKSHFYKLFGKGIFCGAVGLGYEE